MRLSAFGSSARRVDPSIARWRAAKLSVGGKRPPAGGERGPAWRAAGIRVPRVAVATSSSEGHLARGGVASPSVGELRRESLLVRCDRSCPFRDTVRVVAGRSAGSADHMQAPCRATVKGPHLEVEQLSPLGRERKHGTR